MDIVLCGIKDADIYIGDAGVFSNNWESYIKLIGEILCRLCENGFTMNPLKCEWTVNETDWLCYWLTPSVFKP
eukprot:15364671-Ditylum_brightwellii.AAC.1